MSDAPELFDGLPQRLKTAGYKGRAYAAEPSTGPAGETCKSCAHYAAREWDRRYLKCGLMRAYWTRGPGTDIKAGSPACSRWERPE